MKQYFLKLLTRPEWTLLIIIIVYSFIPVFGGFLRIFELVSGLVIAPTNPRALANPYPIVVHIIANFVFCILGALQFLPSIRRYRPSAHRIAGRTVAVAGCISAATGVWMTHFYTFPIELQGSLLYLVRLGLGFAMISLIIWAVIAIKLRKIFQHSAAMLRAFAIAQGASTQTFLGISWIIIYGTEPIGPMRDGLMVFAWIINICVAEFLIYKFLTRK